MPADKDYVVTIPDFRARPSEQMDGVVNNAVKSYHDIGNDLAGQLGESGLDPESKTYAIYLAGQLHAVGAVSILIANIDFKATKVDPKGGIGRWGMYPAQEALSKIGSPSVNMILDLLADESQELRRKLMCFVISDVHGKDLAKMLVKGRYEGERDPAKKARLDDALKVFDGA